MGPATSTLIRRLEADEFFLWPGTAEDWLDVEMDQRLRSRKLSLSPAALLDREGRRSGGGSGSSTDSVGCALNGFWNTGAVGPKPESGATLGAGRREEVRGR